MATRRKNTNRRKHEENAPRQLYPDDNKSRGSSNHSRRRRRPTGISPLTVQACVILSLAIVASVVWNWLDSSADPKVRSFLNLICSSGNEVYCHVGLVPSRRTQQATRKIFRGETILEIPRHLQIWDLDALRDHFVREELFSARRVVDGSPLPSAAFLAAYLARLQKTMSTSAENDEHPILKSYLTNVLPTFKDYDEFHPLLWDEKELAELLGKHTATYAHVRGHREALHEEYRAFARVSSEFADTISQQDYFTARLNVMTRSFGTGKLRHDDDSKDNDAASVSERPSDGVSEEELAFYKSRAGVDLGRGSHAMVPVLDLYDHHAKPNVAFHYSAEKRAFVVSTVSAMAVGQEVMDSYGKRTDSDLFAKFGFVNGDGSGWTEAGINLWHQTDFSTTTSGGQQNERRKREIKDTKEKALLLNYLRYDDGYEECVDPQRDNTAWQFKKLKFQYLLSIAPETPRWVAQMSPRDLLSLPAQSTDSPITLKPPPLADLKKLQFDGTLVFGTCRLLSLTHMDYNGNATLVLQEALSQQRSVEKRAFLQVLAPTSDGLEYRTQLCVARLASTALGRFQKSVEEQEALVARLNQESFGARNWTISHLHLGEMHSLKTLQQVAFMSLRRIFGEDALSVGDGDPLYSMRNDLCPPELQRPLLRVT